MPDLIKNLPDSPGVYLFKDAKGKRYVIAGSQTDRSMDQIKKVFPKYKFRVDEKGRTYHYVFIVSGKLVNPIY